MQKKSGSGARAEQEAFTHALHFAQNDPIDEILSCHFFCVRIVGVLVRVELASAEVVRLLDLSCRGRFRDI